jgi:uncharacterized protein YndB with AHSA1/START domain
MQNLGTYTRHDDHLDVRFERHYPRPVDTVWKALTEPERLADWMGRSVVEPRVGGRYETMLDGIKPMHGRVTVWDPPKTLELHWSNEHSPDATVRYELSPEADGTRLVFTHRHMPFATCALMLPGWHVFLHRLGQSLGRERPPDFDPEWRRMQSVYIDRYRLEGVQLDP